MTLGEQLYRELLATHDWFYDYSDDHTAWSRGKAMSQKIFGLRAQVDPTGKIWNEYAPDQFKIKQ